MFASSTAVAALPPQLTISETPRAEIEIIPYAQKAEEVNVIPPTHITAGITRSGIVVIDRSELASVEPASAVTTPDAKSAFSATNAPVISSTAGMLQTFTASTTAAAVLVVGSASTTPAISPTSAENVSPAAATSQPQSSTATAAVSSAASPSSPSAADKGEVSSTDLEGLEDVALDDPPKPAAKLLTH
jgi:hypothetical protein